MRAVTKRLWRIIYEEQNNSEFTFTSTYILLACLSFLVNYFPVIIFSLPFRKGIICHEINLPKSNKAPVIFKGNFLLHNMKLLKDKCISKAQQIALIAAPLSHN